MEEGRKGRNGRKEGRKEGGKEGTEGRKEGTYTPSIFGSQPSSSPVVRANKTMYLGRKEGREGNGGRL